MRVALPTLGRGRRGVRFLDQPVRALLNPSEATGMPFWSLNPYVGCEFGCRYCYARFAHRYALQRARDAGGLRSEPGNARRSWKAFERTILVKRREQLEVALERDLARLRRRPDSLRAIALGTATDPYQPAERLFGITRVVLQRLCAERGLRVGIVTKSPLVRRDAQLLADLARRNEVAVHVSLISTDARVVRLFEPRSPLPHARLRALADLAAAGLTAGIICAPVLPGLTDGTRGLRRVVLAARDAGAGFAHAGVLRLYPAVREPFLPVLERWFPALAARYRAAYGRATDAPSRYCAALDARFSALVRDAGLRVQPFPNAPQHRAVQMGLW